MSVDVITFGCRLNTYESEVIRRQARAADLPETVVFNTCAVTAEAVRQSRQAIRRLKRERPHLTVVINGGVGSLDEALEHIGQGLGGAMLGRAAYHDPGILGAADRRLFGEPSGDIAPAEAVERFLDLRLLAGAGRGDQRARAA